MNKLLLIGNHSNSNKWIFKNVLLKYFTDILLIQKVKNRWVCSVERLDAIDFNKYSYYREYKYY